MRRVFPARFFPQTVLTSYAKWKRTIEQWILWPRIFHSGRPAQDFPHSARWPSPFLRAHQHRRCLHAFVKTSLRDWATAHLLRTSRRDGNLLVGNTKCSSPAAASIANESETMRNQSLSPLWGLHWRVLLQQALPSERNKRVNSHSPQPEPPILRNDCFLSQHPPPPFPFLVSGRVILVFWGF